MGCAIGEVWTDRPGQSQAWAGNWTIYRRGGFERRAWQLVEVRGAEQEARRSYDDRIKRIKRGTIAIVDPSGVVASMYWTGKD